MQYDAFGASWEVIPQLNVKKIVEVWDWITLRAGRDGEPLWYQGTWMAETGGNWDRGGYRPTAMAWNNSITVEEVNECGTACCVAGYSLLEQTEVVGGQRQVARTITNHLGEELLVGNVRSSLSWHHAGRFVLGLTETEALYLFNGQNDKDDILRHLNSILAHRGESIVLS